MGGSGTVVGDDLPGRTVLGCNNIIGHHAVVGIKCQDMKYKVFHFWDIDHPFPFETDLVISVFTLYHTSNPEIHVLLLILIPYGLCIIV